MNQALHKKYLIDVLRAIYGDPLLDGNLYFKGGTALYLFYDLPRFSTDLDFDLNPSCANPDEVFVRLREVILRFGELRDEKKKYYGWIYVVRYEKFQRLLKVEISTRGGEEIENRNQKTAPQSDEGICDLKNLFGVDVKVLPLDKLCAQKLCALYGRIKARDLFDAYFILMNGLPIDTATITTTTGKTLPQFWKALAKKVKTDFNKRNVLYELGEMIEPNKRAWVRDALQRDTLKLLSEKGEK